MVSDFTREQLENDSWLDEDLAAFALAMLDRAEKAEELTEDKDRTLAQAIKSHLREVDKRKQAETISAGNLARAEKAEADRDRLREELESSNRQLENFSSGLSDALEQRDKAREKLRALQEKSDRHESERDSFRLEADRLREELLGAKVAWDMCDAVRRGLREELMEAEDAIREVVKLVLGVKTGEPREAIWSLLKSFKSVTSNTPAVRRARERKEKEEQC